MPGPFENIPYVNFHELNLDWIIDVVKDFLNKYEHIQELIRRGEESITGLTEEGLNQLNSTATELKALLNEWYNTHSEDIALQLANSITEFNRKADQKTAASIASIPADYSSLSALVTEINAKKANKKMITGGELGARSSGMIGTDGSTSGAGNHVEASITGNSFYLINGYSFNETYPLYYIKNSNGDIIETYGNTESAYNNLLIYAPVGSTTIFVDGQGSGANQSRVTNITQAVDFADAYDRIHIIHHEVLPNNSDFDNLKENMRIFFGNGYTYANTPISEGYLEVTAYTTGLITQQVHTLQGRSWLFRAFYSNRWHDWNPEQMFIMPEYLPADDATAVLSAMLNASKYVKLGAGTCIIDGLQLPTGAMLEGCGDQTVLKLKNNSSANYAVRMTGRNTISNLRIIGADSEYTPVITVGTKNGIELTGSNVFTNKINNVSVSNFDGRGIYLYDTGPNHRDCALLNNIFISNCCIGLSINNSEYCRANNINIYNCYFACVNNAGNNIFTGCTFHGFQCFVIDNTSSEYPNNGHGSCIGCTFNHAMGSPITGDYAILMKHCENGFLFSGCQCFFSRVDISDSKGIMFTGCEFGDKQVIRIIDCTEAQLNGCIFINASGELPTIQRTSSSLQVLNCYTKDGVQVQ